MRITSEHALLLWLGRRHDELGEDRREGDDPHRLDAGGVGARVAEARSACVEVTLSWRQLSNSAPNMTTV